MPLRLISSGQSNKKYIHQTKIGMEIRTVTQIVFTSIQLPVMIAAPVNRIDHGWHHQGL
jgi:hypothetical protein